MAQIKGLIFDLDGTLTLTQHFHFLAYREVFKNMGLEYTREDDYRFAGQGSSCIFPKFCEEKGRKISKKEIEKFSAEKKTIYDRLLQENELETVPGIQNFLEKMKQKKLKMAVASGNKLESIELILKQTGLRDFFSVIVTNKDIQHSKPAPDIFLKAAEKLGFNAGECVVFEDAVSGVKAAKSGGISCVALLTGAKKDDLIAEGASFAISSYDELDDDFLDKIG